MPRAFAALSCLTQLDSLQLHSIANHSVRGKHLTAALSSLTRLTRLSLRFEDQPWSPYDDPDAVEDDSTRIVLPWTHAVCGLTNLQQLCVTAAAADDWYRAAMFRGVLPAALSQLTALRHFTVLGMDAGPSDLGIPRPLEALPALEVAVLRLKQRSDTDPSLGNQQHIVLSRLVSLSLALQVWTGDGGCWSTRLPIGQCSSPDRAHARRHVAGARQRTAQLGGRPPEAAASGC